MRAVTTNSLLLPSSVRAMTVTSPRGLRAVVPIRLNSSVPVSPSYEALTPALNCSGRTPMFTRLLR